MPDSPGRRLPQDGQVNQLARLMRHGLGLHARLIGVKHAGARELAFGGHGPAVELEPVQAELSAAEQVGHDAAEEPRKPARCEAARLAERLPPPLVQVDEDVHRLRQLVAARRHVEHRPARVEKLAFQAAKVAAQIAAQRSDVALPIDRQFQPPAVGPRLAMDRAAQLRQARRPVPRLSRLPHRPRRARARPTAAHRDRRPTRSRRGIRPGFAGWRFPGRDRQSTLR